MSGIPFYSRGVYPFESAYGVVLNVANFNCGTVGWMIKELEALSEGVDCFIYEGNFPVRLFPVKKGGMKADHFPGSYHPAPKCYRYCPECSRLGYHSVFTFIPQVCECLIHKRVLISLCPACCRIHQLLKYPLTKGYHCHECGFSLPSAVEQVQYRSSYELRFLMAKLGGLQKRWFMRVFELSKNGGYLCAKLLQDSASGVDEDLNSAVALLAGVQNPYLDVNPFSEERVVIDFWIAGGVDLVSASADGLSKLRSAINTACYEIETTYLDGHLNCLENVQGLAVYSLDDNYSCPICPLALAYALLRIRLNFSGLWDGNVTNIRELDYAYILSAAKVRGWIAGLQKDFFVAYFLRLLGELDKVLEGELVTHVCLGIGAGILEEVFRTYDSRSKRGMTYHRFARTQSYSSCNANVYQLPFEAESFLIRQLHHRDLLVVAGDSSVAPPMMLRI